MPVSHWLKKYHSQTKNRTFSRWRHFATTTRILQFCFLMLIRAIVICSPLGLQNLNLKRKTKWILVVVVKWRHRENGLLFHIYFVFKLPSTHLWVQGSHWEEHSHQVQNFSIFHANSLNLFRNSNALNSKLIFVKHFTMSHWRRRLRKHYPFYYWTYCESINA